jgi:hypothetical protein
MKKAHTILSHLSSLPQFKVLKRQECYQKYINLLSPKWQKAVAFVYIKDETLFIAITHPCFKMEFNYNRDLLKSLLTQLNTYDSNCKMMSASKVEIFHSKYYPIQTQKEKLSTVPHYDELASSSFTIHTQDKELKAKFEQIKEHIRCNR